MKWVMMGTGAFGLDLVFGGIIEGRRRICAVSRRSSTLGMLSMSPASLAIFKIGSRTFVNRVFITLKQGWGAGKFFSGSGS